MIKKRFTMNIKLSRYISRISVSERFIIKTRNAYLCLIKKILFIHLFIYFKLTLRIKSNLIVLYIFENNVFTYMYCINTFCVFLEVNNCIKISYILT